MLGLLDQLWSQNAPLLILASYHQYWLSGTKVLFRAYKILWWPFCECW